MNKTLAEIPHDISEYNSFFQATRVTKGWSLDKKYRVVTESGRNLMLRIADASLFKRKKFEFEALTLAAKVNLLVPHPISFGICDGGRCAFLLVSWIEGRDMADVLVEANNDGECYVLGLEAGRLLRRIHELPALPMSTTWPQMFERRLIRYVAGLDECDIALPGREAFECFIATYRNLVCTRPLGFAHGDFHGGNLVVTPDGKVAAIDFDRCRTADPWDDHKRVVFDAEVSPAFATGRIDGYFDGTIPDEFWPLLGVYCASNALGSIAWSLPFGENEVTYALQQAKDLLAAYDGMTRIVPAWYKAKDTFFESTT